jgi:hypothetical protein
MTPLDPSTVLTETLKQLEASRRECERLRAEVDKHLGELDRAFNAGFQACEHTHSPEFAATMAQSLEDMRLGHFSTLDEVIQQLKDKEAAAEAGKGKR